MHELEALQRDTQATELYLNLETKNSSDINVNLIFNVKTVNLLVAVNQKVVALISTLVFKFNLLLSPLDCLDISIRSILPPNHPEMYLFCLRNIELVTIYVPEDHFVPGLFGNKLCAPAP